MQKSKQVRTAFNYVPVPGRQLSGLSQVVRTPGQAYTIAELMQRQKMNLPIEASFRANEYYDPADRLPDLASLDLAQKEALKREYAAEIRRIQKLKDQELQKHKEALQKAENERFEQFARDFVKKQGEAPPADPEKH